MKNSHSYMKPASQIHLESILQFLKEKELTVSQLRVLPEYKEVNRAFKDALTDMIHILVHEKTPHELITFIARSYTSQYYTDCKEYDTLYEVISEAYIGLYDVIKKSAGSIDHRGLIRINILARDPELFVFNLRAYICRNIILDIARRHGLEVKYIEPDTAFFSDEGENESCSKLDSVIYNKHNIENCTDFTEDIIRRESYKPDTCFALINGVITRFMSRKAVAGYIYLRIIAECYNPMAILTDLRTKDFNKLFHTLLHDLEARYNVDLSCYDNTVFRADKYLSSLRSVDDDQARSRIDRLASRTRKDVQKIPAFVDAKSEHVCVNGKYFCL